MVVVARLTSTSPRSRKPLIIPLFTFVKETHDRVLRHVFQVGSRKTLVDCKSFITIFISKLVLYTTNISKHQFPQLDSLKDELIDEDLTTYRNYLQSLNDDMVERFQDVIALNIPNWYSNPFELVAVDCEDDVHEELIELRNDNDTTMQYSCNGKEGLWYHQNILKSYPNLWKHLKLLLLAFPASYLVLAMLEIYFSIK
ncbi:uncharacterized protein LOC118766052 [Octopus sinensis]|uniref:Uncharacterized protein LOC118766052 n=1 Tax=Octopus sinensis TaxID=2607531 RepID=A0A7E6FBH0_9MOLL|nr:uncharacterized protein LOC118766052 [Octopus sinensis]